MRISTPAARAGASFFMIASLGAASALVHARSALPSSPSGVSAPERPVLLGPMSTSAPAAPLAPTSALAQVSAPSPAPALEAPLETLAELKASVVRADDGKLRVSLSRPGYVVMLRSGAVRAAGDESASILLDSLQKQADEPVTWDAFDPLAPSIAIERGFVRVTTGEGAEISASASRIGAPPPVATLDGHFHRCAAFSDGAGGFSALCRLRPGAWRVGAANITGPDPAEDVWILDGRTIKRSTVDPATGLPRIDTFVRLDVPLSLGSVEGRMLAYMEGSIGVVVRAEASRLPGEEPSILFAASARAQSISFSMPMPPSTRKMRSVIDLDF